MRIYEWANGKWAQIITALLGEEYTNQRKHCACPRGEGTDRFRFSDKHGNGNYFCACSDGKKGGFDLLMCAKGWDFKTAAVEVERLIGKAPSDDEKPERRGPTYAERLRLEAKPSQQSKYLASRGLEVAPGLHFHRAVDYYGEDGAKKAVYPAMLAPIMKGEDFCTYHVTYLLNGAKAPEDTPRKILPAPLGISGGAVPLYEPAEEMGIGEGIESSIAAKMQFGVPVWAALSAGTMEAWEPPAIAKSILIFADNDSNYVGQAAAYKLAARLHKKGLKVDIAMPGTADTDWNDCLLSAKEKK